MVQYWSIFKWNLPGKPFSQTSTSVPILDFIVWDGDVALPKKETLRQCSALFCTASAEPGPAWVNQMLPRGLIEQPRCISAHDKSAGRSWAHQATFMWRGFNFLDSCTEPLLEIVLRVAIALWQWVFFFFPFFKVNERLINDLCRLMQASFTPRPVCTTHGGADWLGQEWKVSLRKEERNCHWYILTFDPWPPKSDQLKG